MSEEFKKVLEEAEKNLSQERKEELDRAGETVSRFMLNNSCEAVNSFIESLTRQEQILFITAGLWNGYKFLKTLEGVAV
jgi:hypothetical protein